jgi:hypothetical protein
MFFSVTTSPDQRFSNNHQIGKLWVNCDSGWQLMPDGFYKGYQDNYCRINIDTNGIGIDHSQPRSFPLWYQPGAITNLPAKGNWQQAWTDDSIAMDSMGMVLLTKVDQDLTVPDQQLTVDRAVGKIMQQLNQSTEDLFKYQNKNLKLFCSGGVDTFLLYGMLTAHGLSFDLVEQEHYEDDTFTRANRQALESFWSYKQIHHWSTPAWLATGSHGDEYFLRGPAVIAMLTAWHDIDFGQLLEENTDAYHYRYFKKYPELWANAWANRHTLREQCPTREQLNQQIINNLINDHQYWHLGDTTTWTPFKNIELVKILLQCDVVDLLPQFLDAQITKTIIQQYSPGVLDFVSKYKNYDSREHLSKFFAWHNEQK